jgi:hypothetical protein
MKAGGAGGRFIKGSVALEFFCHLGEIGFCWSCWIVRRHF